MNQYAYVYVDESGEFGMTADSSDNLLVVALKTNDPRGIEKIARKVWGDMRLGKTNAQEIHATDADDRVVNKVLKLLNKKDYAVEAYLLKKPRNCVVDVHELYYRMLEALVARNHNAFEIAVDKRDTNKKRREMIAKLTRPHIFERVIFEDSRKLKQLQVVDVVAWALFQKYEFGITEYADLLNQNLLHIRNFTEKRKPSALTNH